MCTQHNTNAHRCILWLLHACNCQGVPPTLLVITYPSMNPHPVFTPFCPSPSPSPSPSSATGTAVLLEHEQEQVKEIVGSVSQTDSSWYSTSSNTVVEHTFTIMCMYIYMHGIKEPISFDVMQVYSRYFMLM